MIRGFAAVLMCLATLACGGGAAGGMASGPAGPPTPPAAATAHVVAPNATDPAIATYLDPHYALPPAPGAGVRNRLFVFLPGTGGRPAFQQLVLQTGSVQGYHAVGLMYPNTPSIGSLCDDSEDPDAHGKARREIVTGQDLSPLVAVGPSECIEHRLAALLAHLDAAYPSEGWGRFLAAGGPDWSKVVIAGHSQGGGHAGIIAKLHPVLRAVCFSSPADWRTRAGQPASWYAQAGATPADRVFGFSHRQDEVVSWPLVTANWLALGLGAFGTPVDVESGAAPYGGSHLLTSNLPHAPQSGAYPPSFHGATVVDVSTPLLGDGTPAYRPAWVHLCFP